MSRDHFHAVGKDIRKVDGVQLVTGAAAFADDFPKERMLHGKILGSPHAHATILSIDTSRAEALRGVHAVLTHENVLLAGAKGARQPVFERVAYTRAGQDYPEPSPWDFFLLDRKVRFVGDRVAAVAAETPEIAREAIDLIDVKYEVHDAVLTPREALAPGAPIVHDEPDARNIEDAGKNLCAAVDVHLRDLEKGLAEADLIVEGSYTVQRVQHAQLELHTAISYLGGDGRLTVIAATQVPFHVRRQLAQVLGWPVGRIRVIKPRIGGGFGGKQEMVIEDLCAALTLATNRPVRLELDRREDLVACRCRHAMELTCRTGSKKDGTFTAMELTALVDAGAYGSHSPTVPTNTGNKNLPRYRCPNMHYKFDAAYTNLVPTGAMRGYGTPQGSFALECHIDEVAEKLGIDPVELRIRTTVRAGDKDELSPHIYEVKTESPGPVDPSEGAGWPIDSCGMEECLVKGAEAISWKEKRSAFDEWNGKNPVLRKGIGMCCLSQGSGVAGIDTANATVKLNEDGSVNLFVGAADLGTGGDTVLVQMVAETLGLDAEDVTIYAADTDIVPFDSGAYASSTTYVSGGAAIRAAEEVRDDLIAIASKLLGESSENLVLENHAVFSSKSDKSIPIRDVATHSMYKEKEQIEHTARFVSPVSPPPFAAQFAEIEVDTESGEVRVVEFVSAIDAGTIISPKLASGQVDGAVSMGIGYALFEEMPVDSSGTQLMRGLNDYKIVKADGMPRLKTIFIETYEPSAPFGAKAVAEIPTNGVAPAIGNALKHALGVRLRELPFTPERILRAIGKME